MARSNYIFLYSFSIGCLYLFCRWRSNYQDPINQFNSATFLCLSLVRMLNTICRGLFCVQWFEVRRGCWWNYWLSQLKITFHKILTRLYFALWPIRNSYQMILQWLFPIILFYIFQLSSQCHKIIVRYQGRSECNVVNL